MFLIQGIELLFIAMGTYFDIKSRELPIRFLAGFGFVGILCNVLWTYQSLSAVLGSFVIGGMFLMIGWISSEAIGYADATSFIILGIFQGWQRMIGIVFVAFLGSGFFGIWRILKCGAKGKDTMPFFPFLFLAELGVLVL